MLKLIGRRSVIFSFASIFAATSHSAAQIPEAPGPTAEPKLTVEEVLRRTRAGISEDLIIAAVKKNGKAFDLNTDEILDLKKYGVSDTVVKYMLDPSQPYSPPPTPVTLKPEKKYPSDPVASRIPPDPGLYIPSSAGVAAVELRVLLGAEAPKGFMKKKGKSTAYLLGASAKARLSIPPGPFYLRMPDGKQIEEVLLLSLTPIRGRRELDLGPAGAKQQYSPADIHSFESLEVGAKLYRIDVSKLRSGEYLIFFIGSADPSKGVYGKGYDFGVDPQPAALNERSSPKK